MNRLIEPDEGRITLFGEEITHVQGSALRSVRRRVGMIFQQFNLVSRLTVIQNVLSGRLSRASGVVASIASLVRLFPRSETELAMRCLARVGMAEYAYRRADQLSGGQQQRVAIARTLAQEPQMILADEPIASLDPGSSEIVMQTLRAICRESGMAVVVSLHQVDAALAFADRVIAMKGGTIVMDRPTPGLTEAEVNMVYRDDPDALSDAAAGDSATAHRRQFLGANR
jgi:phosphonate transport system ATP-binding protein